MKHRRYNLIPQYTCRLPISLRRQICCEMLNRLTEEDDEESQWAVFSNLSACLEDWYQQERGDVEEDELTQIAEMVRRVIISPYV